MTTYVVRLQQDADGRPEFVGVFLAHSIEQLEGLVEDCCSKFICEYAAVPADGMYCAEHKVPGPERLYEEGAEQGLRRAETLSEDWPRLFFGETEPDWRPLCTEEWSSEEQRRQELQTARHKLGSYAPDEPPGK